MPRSSLKPDIKREVIMINLVLSIYLLTKIYIVRRLLKGFGTVQNRNSESKLVPMFVEYPSQFLRTRSGIIGFDTIQRYSNRNGYVLPIWVVKQESALKLVLKEFVEKGLNQSVFEGFAYGF